MFGVNPSIEDIYNLIPWTWLVDWYSDLGNYISLMDEINLDQSLFNYGFLTYVSKGKLTSLLQTKVTNTHAVTFPPGPTNTSTRIEDLRYTALATWKYQKRIDISGLSGVKTISKPSSLGASQLAILGALLTKFTHS